jgi:signal transduction histidine kinase
MLMAFSEHGRCFQVTHSWAVGGVPVAPSEVLPAAQFPWFTQQIRSGHIVSVSSSIDLPTVAAKERDYLRQSGVKSALVLPLLMEGTIVGAVSFASLRSERRWPLGLVSRLRLTGEILALGIRRHQYAQGLQAIAQTMEEVSPDHAAPGTKAAAQFRDRAMRLMQAEHQERRRMGLVLHEDVMQILSAVGMFVQSQTTGTSQSPAIDKALTLLREATQKLRKLTLELRPDAFFEMTFADGVRWLVGQMRRRYDLDVDIRIADPVGPVGEGVRNFLYDSARKLLENVANHASCSQATLEITLSDPNYIHLTVSDEGVGFNPASLQDLPIAAFGLFSIREQAELLGGMLEVTSSPGQGTRVVVTVPLGV